MSLSFTSPRYLLRWDHSNDPPSMGASVTSMHRLGELSIFSDIGLADLIDCHPRHAITVSQSGDDPSHPSERQFGHLGSHDGKDSIESLRRGRFSLILRDVYRHNSVLKSFTQRLNEELAECLNLWDIDSHQADLLIESPGSQTYLSCDGKPTVRWQVRGSSHFWKYPVSLPMVDPRSIERYVIHHASATKSLYYEPALEDHASVFELPSGGMISMPMFAPYRVSVDRLLSVSLVTRYFDHRSRRRYETLVGNHVVGNLFNARVTIDRDGVLADAGPAASIKRSIARNFCSAALNRAGQPCAGDDAKATFQIDPNSPNGIRRMADSGSDVIANSSAVSPVVVEPILSASQVPTPVATTES